MPAEPTTDLAAAAEKLHNLLEHSNAGFDTSCFKCKRAARQILLAAGVITDNPDFNPAERAVARLLMPGAEYGVDDANEAEAMARGLTAATKWHHYAEAFEDAAADAETEEFGNWLNERAKSFQELATETEEETPR